MSSNNPELNISVTFRHTESTAALKAYATEKITHTLSKYLVYNADVHIVLAVEKRDHFAEVNVRSKECDLSLKTVTGDLYSAIDKLADTLGARVKKQKDKLISQKHQSVAVGK